MKYRIVLNLLASRVQAMDSGMKMLADAYASNSNARDSVFSIPIQTSVNANVFHQALAATFSCNGTLIHQSVSACAHTLMLKRPDACQTRHLIQRTVLVYVHQRSPITSIAERLDYGMLLHALVIVASKAKSMLIAKAQHSLTLSQVLAPASAHQLEHATICDNSIQTSQSVGVFAPSAMPLLQAAFQTRLSMQATAFASALLQSQNLLNVASMLSGTKLRANVNVISSVKPWLIVMETTNSTVTSRPVDVNASTPAIKHLKLAANLTNFSTLQPVNANVLLHHLLTAEKSILTSCGIQFCANAAVIWSRALFWPTVLRIMNLTSVRAYVKDRLDHLLARSPLLKCRSIVALDDGMTKLAYACVTQSIPSSVINMEIHHSTTEFSILKSVIVNVLATLTREYVLQICPISLIAAVYVKKFAMRD